MRKVHLYGELADKFGKEFTLHVDNVGQMMRLMEANFPQQFLNAFRKGYYKVILGSDIDVGIPLAEENLPMNLGKNDLHIIPVPTGHGRKGVLGIIIGVALIATAFYLATPIVGAAGPGMGLAGNAFTVAGFGVTWGQIASFGASIALLS